ncbi:hypothetical protein [Acidimangrovimonas sediminis]|uniref:hypothetical protein n=1 Tax=Acidimangrovimonas sediminis TaxID=2056283 RepID=UPI0018EA5AA8|nr:hypothetical protein [Acidimangrovimonas sediminis]
MRASTWKQVAPQGSEKSAACRSASRMQVATWGPRTAFTPTVFSTIVRTSHIDWFRM